MERVTILSGPLCAILALAGCSPEENSAPTVPIDASNNSGASGAGPSSGAGGPATGGAGGGTGSGNAGAPPAAGGSTGGSTDGTIDASGTAEGVPPAPREAGNEAGGDATVGGDATPEAADAGDCAGLFCEDFELGQVDSTKWNVQMTGGSTFAMEQQIVAHGRHAAHFHSPGMPTGGGLAGLGYAYLLTKNVPSALRVHNFGRAYYYMTPKPTSVNIGLLFGGTAGFPRPTYMSIASHNGGWQLGFIKQMGSPGGEVQAYPVDVMPVGAWMCLEWEFNDQPDVINLWRDGNLVGPLDPNHINYPPGHNPATGLFNGMTMGLIGAFTDFGFGFYDWHPANFPFDLYYDDIVLDTKRVGCL